MILAPIADNELVRLVQIYGDEWYMAFLTRPIALAIIAAFLAFVVWRGFHRWRQKSLAL